MSLLAILGSKAWVDFYHIQLPSSVVYEPEYNIEEDALLNASAFPDLEIIIAFIMIIIDIIVAIIIVLIDNRHHQIAIILEITLLISFKAPSNSTVPNGNRENRVSDRFCSRQVLFLSVE